MCSSREWDRGCQLSCGSTFTNEMFGTYVCPFVHFVNSEVVATATMYPAFAVVKIQMRFWKWDPADLHTGMLTISVSTVAPRLAFFLILDGI